MSVLDVASDAGELDVVVVAHYTGRTLVVLRPERRAPAGERGGAVMAELR